MCSLNYLSSQICREENCEIAAKQFVDNLITRGSTINCDETNESFTNAKLPTFYDEEKFKKGQAFFHKHIFSMIIGTFLGLITSLSDSKGLSILMLTKMSNSDYKAFKRYTSTMLHMMIWYESDLKPASELWKSINYVKSKHNAASNRAEKALKYRISQREMVAVQWLFAGLILSRRNFIGIYDFNEENWKCFIHLWRVIGYMLGIEDEFNLCKESVEETRAICNEVTLKIMKPAVEKHEKNYMKMCSYIINGFWAFNQFLEFKSVMFYAEVVLNNSRESINAENEEYRKLTTWQKNKLKIILFVAGIMRFSLVRIFLNFFMRLEIWSVKNWPIFAYIQYGKNISQIKMNTKK